MPQLSRALFRTAMASGGNGQTCVAVARKGDVVEVWDDKKDFSEGNIMTFTAEQFDKFQEGVRTGRTDGLCIVISRGDDGIHEFRSAVQQDHADVLRFDDGEVVAFFEAVNKREFDADAFADLAAG